MNKRTIALVAAGLLAGLLLPGVWSMPMLHGQSAPVPAQSHGRFQMATMNGDTRAYVVVFNPATGECWAQDSAFAGWRALGTPAHSAAIDSSK